jgi:hypothetical protein
MTDVTGYKCRYCYGDCGADRVCDGCVAVEVTCGHADPAHCDECRAECATVAYRCPLGTEAADLCVYCAHRRRGLER